MSFIDNSGLKRVLSKIKTMLDGKLSLTGGTVSDLNAVKATASISSNVTPSYTAIAASPFAREFWHDHFAFLTGGHVIQNHQVTTDGITWADDATDLSNLFMQKDSNEFMLLSKSQLARRFTMYCQSLAYSGVAWYELGVLYTYPFSNFEVYIETSDDGKTWTSIHKSVVDGNSSPYFFRGNGISGNMYLRFTFTKKDNFDTGSVQISCLKAYTSRKGNQGLGIEYEYPYNWDTHKNIFPHTDGKRILGSADKRWGGVYAVNMYASTFNGASTNVKNHGEATDDSVRHVWFSDSNDETKRVYNDNFKYNPVKNMLTTNISGNAATATKAVSADTVPSITDTEIDTLFTNVFK